MMDGLKHIKDRPRLKDKQQMQARVLNRIADLKDKRVNQRMIWWRMAASVLVLFLVGSYSWLEINTFFCFYSRFEGMFYFLHFSY